MFWKSPKWRKKCKLLKKSLISAVILKFTWKSRLSTKSQRKFDYFPLQIQKIVCHDPQIRSIFSLFKKWLNSTNFDPQTQNSRKSLDEREKGELPCSHLPHFSPFRVAFTRPFNTRTKIFIILTPGKKGGKTPGWNSSLEPPHFRWSYKKRASNHLFIFARDFLSNARSNRPKSIIQNEVLNLEMHTWS